MIRRTSEVLYEIVGPDGHVHYRRPAGHPDLEEARRTQGYSVRPAPFVRPAPLDTVPDIEAPLDTVPDIGALLTAARAVVAAWAPCMGPVRIERRSIASHDHPGTLEPWTYVLGRPVQAPACPALATHHLVTSESEGDRLCPACIAVVRAAGRRVAPLAMADEIAALAVLLRTP